MMRLPWSYSVRSLAVRRASTVFTLVGIALTVAVFASVLALAHGLRGLYERGGRDDVAIYLRQGATSEGESALTRDVIQQLVKGRPEIRQDAQGRPLAAAESYLAVYMTKRGGGVTNVPLRGIQPASLVLYGDGLELVSGRWPTFGADEVVIGEAVARRMVGSDPGSTLQLNLTPFVVVGVFRHAGHYNSEVWGDVDRLMTALQRPVYQRVVARLEPGSDMDLVQAQLEEDARLAAVSVSTERQYLLTQTGALATALQILAVLLSLVMGSAAIFGAVNTMVASVAARTQEIGMLRAIGFGGGAVFVAFLLEAAVLGLVGGGLGLLLIWPLRGLETGAMNWNTFTEVAFSFEFPPLLMVQAVLLAVALGLVGGAFPALRAARLRPIVAMRQR